MSKIDVTDTVRGMLSPAAVETVSIFLETVIGRCSIDGKPLNFWAIHPNRRSIVNSQIIDLDRCDAEGLPERINVDISCNLPEGGIIANTVPEEHSFLEVWNGKLWTVGDLAMHNPERFYLLEFLLSTDAWRRVSERLRRENPGHWQVTQEYVRRRTDEYGGRSAS
jgi:hypothetical protein